MPKQINKDKQQELASLLNTDEIQEDDDFKALQLKFTDQEIIKATRPDSIINKEFHEDFKKNPYYVGNIDKNMYTAEENNNKPAQNVKITECDRKQVEDLTKRNQEL